MGKVQVKAGPFARRPDNSAFKQQRLPAWSPSLMPQTVLPIFYSLSLVCLLLGVWLLITVQNTHQVKVDYTDAGTCGQCLEMRNYATNATIPCECDVNFSIPKTFLGDVFFYYGLINFHQNLRRYMDSRDDAQLVGRTNSLKAPSSYCVPFAYDTNGVPIAPCGAVANSMFNGSRGSGAYPRRLRAHGGVHPGQGAHPSQGTHTHTHTTDSFTLYHLSEGKVEIPLLRKGITWYTDKNVKFHNPKSNSTLQQAFQGTAQPLYWQRPVYELDRTDANNNGFINDDLIVWMREAAFPSFKKLYGILNRAHAPFSSGLPAGNYSVHIAYNYPVQYFQGRKEIVLTTLTWFGGPNLFLPVAYLVSGGAIFVAAVALTVVYVKVGRDGKNMEE